MGQTSSSVTYRAAAGVALAAAFILLWLTGATGVIGPEDDDANVICLVVLVVGLIGGFMARLQPKGMARALFAMALTQTMVAVIALMAGLGSSGPRWQQKILELSSFFVVLWLLSAWLFRKAARREPKPDVV